MLVWELTDVNCRNAPFCHVSAAQGSEVCTVVRTEAEIERFLLVLLFLEPLSDVEDIIFPRTLSNIFAEKKE